MERAERAQPKMKPATAPAQPSTIRQSQAVSEASSSIEMVGRNAPRRRVGQFTVALCRPLSLAQQHAAQGLPVLFHAGCFIQHQMLLPTLRGFADGPGPLAMASVWSCLVETSAQAPQC